MDLATLWKPDDETVARSGVEALRKTINRKYGLDLADYHQLHRFSCDRLDDFWETIWEWTGVRFSRKYDAITTKPSDEPGDLPRFFPGAQLNFTENLLYPVHPSNRTSCNAQSPKSWPPSSSPAIIELNETSKPGDEGDIVTWGDLRHRVAVLTEGLRRHGVQISDRIVHVAANTSAPVVSLLATNALGAIFSALATDAGVSSLQSRLAQIKPRVLFADEWALYAGKEINVLERVAEVADRLLSSGAVPDLVVISLPHKTIRRANEWKGRRAKCIRIDDFLASHDLGFSGPTPPQHIVPVDFSHPSLIVFSSGTTGEPKSIVHGTGGLIVTAKKDMLTQNDIKPSSIYLQITTCGWIMWFAQVSALLVGGAVVAYDGSPLYPGPLQLPSLLGARHGSRKNKVTHFGCSPRFLTEVERHCQVNKLKLNSDPAYQGLHNLRWLGSTGGPLGLGNAKYVYEGFASPRTMLCNFSGGTDLAGGILGASPMVPVVGNLIPVAGLGLDLRILDAHTGEEVKQGGTSGELCVVGPFPTQPLFFWGEDRKAMHEKYLDSYYRRFPNRKIWAQGDFISRFDGGYEISGRSDGVLNPSGVRFGSSDIYAVLADVAWVEDSIVVGQRRAGKDDDERVLLFVKLRADDAMGLSQERIQDVNKRIRVAQSARHVPKHIFRVRDIPITANGKKTELAVKAIVSGNVGFKPSSATANPEALDEYRQYADLEGVIARQSREAKL